MVSRFRHAGNAAPEQPLVRLERNVEGLIVEIVALEEQVLVQGKDGVELHQGVAERAIAIMGLKLPRWPGRKTASMSAKISVIAA